VRRSRLYRRAKKFGDYDDEDLGQCEIGNAEFLTEIFTLRLKLMRLNLGSGGLRRDVVGEVQRISRLLRLTFFLASASAADPDNRS